MIRLFILVLLIVFTLPAKADLPRLSVKGNILVGEDNMPVTLRGVSLCSLAWHNGVSLIEQAATDLPLNVVRLPVQSREWNRVGAENYIRDYLDPAVASCTKNNVYCVIDWHIIKPWTDENTIRKLKEFWRIVAPRYADNPNILYEIYNEPTKPKARTEKNWLAWRKAAQSWVDMVRAAAPDTVILVGNPHWDQMPSFAVTHPFMGSNLVYVLHLYPQFKPKSWDKLFGKASEKIPLFISEWGWSAAPDNQKKVFAGSREEFGEPLRAYLDERPQISWSAWSYDPKCGPAMLGKDKDMLDFTRDWLNDFSKRDP